MFSETQMQIIVRDLNSSLNIPLISESREGVFLNVYSATGAPLLPWRLSGRHVRLNFLFRIQYHAGGRIINKLVEKINPHIEPALRAIIPDIYVDCLRIALTEGVSAKDRRKQISSKLIEELEPGLTQGLNDRIDSRAIPDMWEDDLLRQVSKKIIKEFVEWTIGELDERLARSYEEVAEQDEEEE